MNMTERDAAEALDAIAAADQQVRRHRSYLEGSPFLILWGFIWFVANGVTGLAPQYAALTWNVCVVIGTLVTAGLVVMQSLRLKRAGLYSEAQGREIGRRAALTGIAVMTFFPATLYVMAPSSGMQQNAYISLCWAFAYMVAGAWLGWKLFITGLVTVLAILVGYALLREHYALWMAVVGGGSLMLGGLWLRKL